MAWYSKRTLEAGAVTGMAGKLEQRRSWEWEAEAEADCGSELGAKTGAITVAKCGSPSNWLLAAGCYCLLA